MSNKFSKIISLLTAATMLLPIASCGNKNSANTISDIKLSESVRSWSNKEDKYSELLEKYGTNKCNGAMVVATDDGIWF